MLKLHPVNKTSENSSFNKGHLPRSFPERLFAHLAHAKPQQCKHSPGQAHSACQETISPPYIPSKQPHQLWHNSFTKHGKRTWKGSDLPSRIQHISGEQSAHPAPSLNNYQLWHNSFTKHGKRTWKGLLGWTSDLPSGILYFFPKISKHHMLVW